MKVMTGRAGLLASSLLAVWSVLGAPAAEGAEPYRGGMVASSHPVAAEAGLAMLKKGGNAVDAAVAAAFAQAVVAPYHSGIGGGGFALTYMPKKGETTALDFREVAPKAATKDMFIREGEAVPALSQEGALSVAVPGAVAGYLELLAKYGKLSPKVVLAPAIRAARDGFRVTPKYVQQATARKTCLLSDEESTRLFLRKNAQGEWDAPAVGTLLQQPELARTLRRIAQVGANAFYGGKVAKAIAATVKERGGVLTEEDLASYKVRWRKPLEGSYRGHKLLTMPPPSAGGLAVVQTLEALELATPDGIAFRDPEVLHLYAEVLRRVYVDRAKYLGDPAFNDIPLERLMSKPYLEALLASIDRKKATPSQSLLESAATPKPAVIPPTEKKNTTHISTLDEDGNAVSLTTTVNYMFGSCLTAKGMGVVLNDEMDDFAAKPLTANVFGLVTGEANAVAPGKIPLSSMSPTLVFQKEDPKKVMIVVGSPGGSTIPTTVVQVVSNIIDHGMGPLRAVAQGRLHHQYMPDAIMVDRWGLEPATARALEAKGHQLAQREAWGDAEVVYVDPTTQLRYGGADPRNEGVALGHD